MNPTPDTPAAASSAAETDERLTRMEIQLAYAEDLLDTLNTLVARQQDQIDRLLREVVQLHRQREHDSPGGPGHPIDERPPHY
jgi:SlyX protein